MLMLSFVFFSIMDFFTLFLITTCMFRFPLRSYVWSILLFCIFISNFSYFMHHVIDMPYLAPGIQLIIAIFFIRFIYKIHIFHSLIVTSFGYLTHGVLQTFIILILLWFNFIPPLEVMMVDPVLPRIMQFVTAGIMGGLCYIAHRLRLGFIFIPENDRGRIIRNKDNFRLLLLSLLAMVLIALIYYIWSIGFAFSLFSISAVFLYIILMYIFHKEIQATRKRMHRQVQPESMG